MRLYLQLFFLFLFTFLLEATPFKVASYNVENLFDATPNGSEYPEYTPKYNWNTQMVENKLNHTAEVICDLEAQIVGVQEIENESILKQLQSRIKEVGCAFYPYYAITSTPKSSVQVALLSQFPIMQHHDIVVSNTQGVRNILEAEVKVDDQKLLLFVNHWKSKGRGGVESKRILYAKALKRRIEQISDKEYILLGDFNTNYNDYLGIEKKLDDTYGKTGIHDVLKTTQNKMPIDEKEIVDNLENYHFMLWLDLSEVDRWSVSFFGKKGTPDHIILPSSLFDGKGIDYINDSFRVFRAEYLFHPQGYIYRHQIKKGKHTGEGYSDHLPVFASFDTKPYSISTQYSTHISTKIKNSNEDYQIETLYQKEKLDKSIILKNAIVIWKEKENAILKQTTNGRGIYLYRCAESLEVGKRYDIEVKEIYTYRGLKEITKLSINKTKNSDTIDSYFIDSSQWLLDKAKRQNEIVKNIIGYYRNGVFESEGRVVSIYFKNKNTRPPNGTKLKLLYAHLGYYNGLQLVIYHTNDFEILE